MVGNERRLSRLRGGVNCGSRVRHRSAILPSPACTRKRRVSALVRSAEAEVELSLTRSTQIQDTSYMLCFRTIGASELIRQLDSGAR